MIHSYNKNNSEYDFFGLNSDKKKKTEGDAYPYRAKLGYDSAPSLLGRISSSDNTPSLFAPQFEGERIRKQLQSTVDKALGKSSNSGIFDNIDTKKIEENIPVAESVIKKNKEKNAYSMEDTKNLPNLRDGLALFYASSEAGNHKAANVARKIAYTPDATTEKKRETESKTPDFFGASLKKSDITPAVMREKVDEKDLIEQLPGSYDKNAGVISKLSYDVKDQKTDPKQVDSYPVLDKENILSSIFPSYEASKELIEHIKTGFNDYDDNTFFDIIAAGATALRLNPATSLLANVPKYIVRGICKLGADFYLRKKKGYTFSADLFEHSLQENPNDLVFYDDSDVSKKLKADENLLNKIDTMVEKIENNISFAKDEKSHRFDKGDMYYSLYHCNIDIVDIKENEDGTKDITVHINDRYDFTKITSFEEGGPSFGTLANDAALFASWIDSINPYQVDIYFTVRR